MNIQLSTTSRQKNKILSKVVISICITTFFVGCFSSSKIDKWVGKHYEQSATTPVHNSRGFLTVKTTDQITATDEFSITENHKYTVLPLPFYAQWQSSNICTLNEFVPLNIFSATANLYANKLGLKKLLNGQTLEITVCNLPHWFSVVDKGWAVWPIPYLGAKNVSIDPSKRMMVVKFRLLQGITVVKSGTITLPNTDKEYHEKGFQSPRKMTDKYLCQYDESIKTLSVNCINKLLPQLQEDANTLTMK